MKRIAMALAFVLVLPGFVRAQGQPQGDTTQEQLRAMEERIRALETQIAEMKALLEKRVVTETAAAAPAAPTQAPATVPAPPGAGAPSGQLPVYGGSSALGKILNPDISVISDFLGAVGENRIRSVPVLEMHETEVGFQAIVDPYARADVFLAFGPEGVELEEGYLTFTSLPGGFVTKVGKMRAGFGRVNTLHNHNLPWTDRPLVTENLVGGEEGIGDAGISVSRILPAPKDWFLEATGQVYQGNSADVFQAQRRRDVTTVARMRAYKDVSDSTNVDFGFSYARGSNDTGSDFHTQLYGVDATVRWKPLRRAIYHSFIASSEFVWSRREQLPFTERAFGFFTMAEYRLSRRWTVGGRFDRSDRATNASMNDSGFSALLTYWPSEFSQIRGQYRFARYAEGRDANELRFQLLFTMGAHGAHPF
ncbi:MAG TPA: TonB-dependent receptor [Candidatus Acidoferrales bacterium]